MQPRRKEMTETHDRYEYFTPYVQTPHPKLHPIVALAHVVLSAGRDLSPCMSPSAT